jgi:glycosyltransferase involved in cell wall biosynthesis
VILEADLTVANTPDTARQVCEVANPKRLEIIPEGVDPGVFNPQQNSSETRKHLEIRGPWILGIGRLIEWKGFRYLIEAMPKILGQHPDAHLTIGGDGPEMSDLRSLVNELGLGAHVSLPGALTRGTVARYMASADVFVGPSIRDSEGNTEGQGAVFVEAMASGCPAIGTRVGGIPDVIQDGHNGLLVPQRDPLALADAVLRVLGDEEGSRAMAERGMETSRLYSFSEIAKTYSALFRDLRRRGPATVVS